MFVVYSYILLARIISSWLPNLDPSHPIVEFLYRATEPVLRPIRELLPRSGMIDFSPIIAFFLIRLVRQFVVQLLFRLTF